MDRHSQDSEKPLDTKPAEGFSWKKGAAKQQWRSPEFEGRAHPEGDSPRLQLQGVWRWGKQEPR